jgi:thioredoxin reductase
VLYPGLKDLPVVVLGGGPVGMAAVAHLVARGERPILFEQGDRVGASIREWGHVRLFSPWRALVDPVAARLLGEAGWTHPPEGALPTGLEFVERYLEPLAAHPRVREHLRWGHRVLHITRKGMDKVRTRGREQTPFEVVVKGPGGGMLRVQARAVVDATGTWASPNPLGSGGTPAEGEEAHGSRIHYGLPPVTGAARSLFAGKATLVAGSGHSALQVLLELGELRRQDPATRVIWAIRGDSMEPHLGGGAADALPARGSLGRELRAQVGAGGVELVTGFRTSSVTSDRRGRLLLVGDDGRRVGPVDQVVAATGFRPDLALARELRLELDPWLEAPAALAPLVDPNLHSCGTVPPHGYRELAHPEPGFFVVGMKSYGRAPTFLLLTGYEQVRSVVAALTGDMAAAGRVALVLPPTGVCGGAGAGACCA